MARHIKKLYIESFRGIHQLTLRDFNHINILTGDNNSGKTSVLELLKTVDNPHNLGTWAEILRMNYIKHLEIFDLFYNLFSVDDDIKCIKYGYEKDAGQVENVRVEADIKEMQMRQSEVQRINGYMPTDGVAADFLVDVKCMGLDVFVNEKRQSYQVYNFQQMIDRNIDKDKYFVRTVYILPFDHVMEKFYLDEILQDSVLYGEMLEILKEFDEEILNINSVMASGIQVMPEYMILTKRHKKALPLSVYGDGMKKAVMLLSALVCAKDGILLVDEFETAIHISAMDTVFSWILESAKKLNVQVFSYFTQ